MKTVLAIPARHWRKCPGFTLLASLLILSLLTLIAVGLLSLGLIELRTSSSDSAASEARSNAKMGLTLALGDLQKALGPDRAVSASGEILEPLDTTSPTVRHPHWTGVWNSWHAGPVDPAIASPDAPSEHQTIDGAANSGMSPTYTPGRADHFRAWLVSLPSAQATSPGTAMTLTLTGDSMPEGDDEGVRLVGPGTLGEDANSTDHVTAGLMGAGSGRYGWWIGDESQKARIMDDPYEDPDAELTQAETLFRQGAAGSPGIQTLAGLEAVSSNTLAALPSLGSVDLVEGVGASEPSQHFHDLTTASYQIPVDVREGGLKRDLSTLLERPVDLAENGDEFMLYKFHAKDGWMNPDGQEQVPIQDLAAYYQLYDSHRPGGQEGMMYTSNLLDDGLQIISPDFGAKPDANAFMRQYSTLYRSPVPIKVQMLLNITAEERTQAEKDALPQNTDTHKLVVGVTPSLTLWNPTNMPMVMRFNGDNPDLYAQLIRMGNLPLQISWNKNDGTYVTGKKNLFWFVSGYDNYKPHLFNLYFSGLKPVRFEPGEVKVLSLPYRGDVSALKEDYHGNWRWKRHDYFFKTDLFHHSIEASPGWDATAFMLYRRSAPGNNEHVQDNNLTFKASDQISFEVSADSTALSGGSCMMFHLIQTNHQSYAAGGGTWHRRNYQLGCRNGGGRDANHLEFNKQLITSGFPADPTSPSGEPVSVITGPPRSGQQIIQRSSVEEGWPFLEFSLMAGVETHEDANGGGFAGRKFTSRPFLHSTALAASFIDGNDPDSFYNYGWNWWIRDINSVFEANVQVSPENQGYYGGGYSPLSGTTHLVQQEIPAVPPVSIASLSHAHLGGFSPGQFHRRLRPLHLAPGHCQRPGGIGSSYFASHRQLLRPSLHSGRGGLHRMEAGLPCQRTRPTHHSRRPFLSRQQGAVGRFFLLLDFSRARRGGDL